MLRAMIYVVRRRYYCEFVVLAHLLQLPSVLVCGGENRTTNIK